MLDITLGALIVVHSLAQLFLRQKLACAFKPASVNLNAMIEIPQVFSSRQVVTITGVPYSQLNIWTRSGLLRPSIAMAAGSGSRQLFSREDLLTIRIAWNLHTSGLAGKALRTTLDYICENFDAVAGIERIGSDVVVKSGKESISVVRRPGQLYLDISGDVAEAVEHINGELRTQAESLGPVPAQQPSGAAPLHRREGSKKHRPKHLQPKIRRAN